MYVKSNISLRSLEYFVVLSESDSYGAAAEKLGISKSTLSHAISKLEEEFGAELVSRNLSGFALTGSGRAMLESARRVIRDVDRLHASVREAAVDRITIGVPKRCDLAPLLRLIEDYKRECSPNCSFDVVQELYVQLISAVKAGRVPLAYCVRHGGKDPDEGLDIINLGEAKHYCMTAQDSSLAQKESVTFDDVFKYPIVPLSQLQRRRMQTLGDASKAKLKLMELESYTTGVALRVALGQCVTVDYRDWTGGYPGVKGVPIVDAPTSSSYSEGILYRAAGSEPGTYPDVERFWNFAADRGL